MKGGQVGYPSRNVVLLALMFVGIRSVLGDLLDAEALLAFKNSDTQGVKNEILQSWLPGTDPCTVRWEGVRCWSSGKVKWLRLSEKNLDGDLTSVGSLTSLSKLVLNNNSLTGPLPPSLGNLTNLKQLSVQGNQLQGELPQWLSNLNKLVDLNMASNALRGLIPKQLFSGLTSLETVDFSNNALYGSVPEDLLDRPALVSIKLTANQLNGSLPGSLTTSPSLQTVDFSNNLLNGEIPSNWEGSNISYIDLSSNNLTGMIPMSLSSLKSLRVLNLKSNQLLGEVPTPLVCEFGDQSFSNNPLLQMSSSSGANCDGSRKTSPAVPVTSPVVIEPVSSPVFHEKKRSSRLNTVAIIALTVGDVALLLLAAAAFTMFWMFWKKRQPPSDDKPILVESSKDYCHSQDSRSSTKNALRLSPGAVVDTSNSASVSNNSKMSLESRPRVLPPASNLRPALKPTYGVIRDPALDAEQFVSQRELSIEISCEDFGTQLHVLDDSLSIEFEDLLRANAVILGIGPTGSVFMAVTEDGSELAIKKLEKTAHLDENGFVKQCNKIGEIIHPNLLPLKAFCWSVQEKLLIREHMPNGNLTSLLHGDPNQKPGQLDWYTRHKIAVGVARGLHYLHKNDMIHGNVKGNNVLLGKHFQVRLCDYGQNLLFGWYGDKQPLQNNGYQSPQVVASRDRQWTEKDDVYGFGVILLELLTGLMPLGKDNLVLPTWVQAMVTGRKTAEAFDPKVSSGRSLPTPELLHLLRLALLCTSEDPSIRPDISTLLHTLESMDCQRASFARSNSSLSATQDNSASFQTCSNMPQAGFLTPDKSFRDELDDADDDDNFSLEFSDASFHSSISSPRKSPFTVGFSTAAYD